MAAPRSRSSSSVSVADRALRGVADLIKLLPSGTVFMLRAGDFVHAALSLLVFATIALLDADTVACLYPALEVSERTMMAVLPPVVGGVASYAFMVFPNNRHGIGYQPTRATEDFQRKN
uniref:Uncharacterized protein n=1 Tax=Oryza brachyantha TaxID=4533 RepID=J3LP42_ORYBR